jgi:hypothetical protein
MEGVFVPPLGDALGNAAAAQRAQREEDDRRRYREKREPDEVGVDVRPADLDVNVTPGAVALVQDEEQPDEAHGSREEENEEGKRGARA